jgi:hypothetical protein
VSAIANCHVDAKRKKEDKPGSAGRKESDDREGSSPPHDRSSTHSGETRVSGAASPIGSTRVQWRVPGQDDHSQSRLHNTATADSCGLSPRRTSTSGFTAIKPPLPHPHSNQQSYGHGFMKQPKMVDGQMRYEHPMALSTSLAFGFMPSMGLPSVTGTGVRNSPTFRGGTSMSPPTDTKGGLSDLTRLPPIMPDMLSPGDAPSYSGQITNSNFFGDLSSRQLPPLLPSRLSSSHGKDPTPFPASEHMPQHSPGIASLLRAGEHLASSETKSPPGMASEEPITGRMSVSTNGSS